MDWDGLDITRSVPFTTVFFPFHSEGVLKTFPLKREGSGISSKRLPLPFLGDSASDSCPSSREGSRRQTGVACVLNRLPLGK